jgi:hypothetical protein
VSENIVDELNFCLDNGVHYSQNVGVWAKVIRNATGWVVTSAHADDGTQDGIPYAYQGTHAIVYTSAGKHHPYGAPEVNDDFDVTAGIDCTDSSRGDGPWLLPKLSGTKAVLAQIPSNYVGQSETGAWLNACEAARGNVVEIPLEGAGFQSNSLANLGYGFSDGSPAKIQNHYFFNNDGVTGVRDNLAQAASPIADGDNDGKSEVVSVDTGLCADSSCDQSALWCSPYVRCDQLQQPHPGAVLFSRLEKIGEGISTYFWTTQPTDQCPLGEDGTDNDNDQLYGPCDPEPNFKNQYVGPGSGPHPAFNLSAALKQWQSVSWRNSLGKETLPQVGFLDTEQDGIVDGYDMCPNTYGGGGYGAANRNAWGESTNFPLSSQPEFLNLGAFDRGDSCDPYATSTVGWGHDIAASQVSSGPPSCTSVYGQVLSAGSDTATITQSLTVGRSENDPDRDKPPQPQSS